MSGPLRMCVETALATDFFQAGRGHGGESPGAFGGRVGHKLIYLPVVSLFYAGRRVSVIRPRSGTGGGVVGSVEDDRTFRRGGEGRTGFLTAFPVHGWGGQQTPPTVGEGTRPPIVRPNAVVFFP